MSVFAPLICDSTGHLSTVTKCIYFLFTVSLWTKCCFISVNMVESAICSLHFLSKHKLSSLSHINKACILLNKTIKIMSMHREGKKGGGVLLLNKQFLKTCGELV